MFSVRAGLEASEDADYFVLGMKDSAGLDMGLSCTAQKIHKKASKGAGVIIQVPP